VLIEATPYAEGLVVKDYSVVSETDSFHNVQPVDVDAVIETAVKPIKTVMVQLETQPASQPASSFGEYMFALYASRNRDG
jgi:hypothetical protein